MKDIDIFLKMKMNTITLEVPEGINPHDALDYKLSYSKYIEAIHLWGGFITTEAFITLFLLTNKQGRTLLAKLEAECWLGSFYINKHKIYYLKRKSTIMLTKNPKNGDLKRPTLKKLLRVLTLLDVMIKTAGTNWLHVEEQLSENLYVLTDNEGVMYYYYINTNKAINDKAISREIDGLVSKEKGVDHFIIASPLYYKTDVEGKFKGCNYVENYVVPRGFSFKRYYADLDKIFGGEPII